MQAGARAEWETLRHVMVHEPGIEVFFALLSPAAHLYERFFNLEEAKQEHRDLVAMLRSYGVRVTSLREAVIRESMQDESCRTGLAAFAQKRIGKKCLGDACDLPPNIRRHLDEPVRLDERDPAHLFNIALLNPTIVHAPEGIRTELHQPLYNLYFMRDQQAAVERGIIRLRMRKEERRSEADLCHIALIAAGARPFAQISQGHFEGGDFIPAGDIAFIGTGSRTDAAGVAGLAEHLTVDEIAVVHQPRHPLINGYDPMVSMHLDTYFNIAGNGIAVGNPLLLHETAVDVYRRESGCYEHSGTTVPLDEYLREKDYSIIEITTLEQLCYASNFLCIRDSECICPDAGRIAPVVLERLRHKAEIRPQTYGALLRQAKADYAKLKADGEFFPFKTEVAERGIDMNPVSLTNATGGYGGAHCMTCVLHRN